MGDQRGWVELGFRDKPDDFAHGVLQGWKNIPPTVGLRSSELEDPLPSQELISGSVAPCEKPTSFRGHRRKKSVSVGCRFRCRRREAEGLGADGFRCPCSSGP